MDKLTTLERNGKSLNVRFLETQPVKDGVVCDVYEIMDDTTCDLGIVTVQSGYKTPKQKILEGDKTIERCINGQGTLTVQKPNGETTDYSFPGDKNEIELYVGDVMQWSAATELIFYEICYPAYSDGRFQNLD